MVTAPAVTSCITARESRCAYDGARMMVCSSPSSKHVPRKERRYHVKIVPKHNTMTKLHQALVPTCMMSHMMPVRWNPLDDTATVTSRFILLCVLISCSLFSFDSSLRLSSNDGLGMLANRCRNFTYSRQAFWYLKVTKQCRANELNSVWEQTAEENSKQLRSAVCENKLVGE